MYRFSSSLPASFSLRHLRLFAAALLLPIALLSPAHAAQLATTTQLTVASTSIAIGVPTQLTATVADAASHPVLLGTVTFYDGTRSLGSAQIVTQTGGSFAQGTASLKTASFNSGANNITAVFRGTITDASSTSSAKTVTVTGRNKTATALSATAAQGDYTLAAALQSFGAGTPTGNVDFVDTTADATLGSILLSEATWSPGFSIGPITAANSNPQEVATADFNGDGILDLATADNLISLHYVRVQLGNGDGTFRKPINYNLSYRWATDIVAGDFNNDGKVDLATTDFETGAEEIDILLGNGDGTFQRPLAIKTMPNSLGLAVGDFNRDGKLDLVVSAANNGGLGILLGKGDGGFQPIHTYAVSSFGSPIVSDLRGNGIEDLVLVGGSDAAETVLLGKGDGTFDAPVSYPPAIYFSYTKLGDINGDGKPDLVQTDPYSGTVRVSFGKGDGSFPLGQNYTFAPGYIVPFIEDVNQDGKPDIVVLGNDSFAVLLGDGLGHFQSEILNGLTGGTASDSILGDFNGDGQPDIAVIGTSDLPGTAFLLTRETTAQFSLTLPLSSASDVVQADYSGDPKFKPSSSNPLTLKSILTIDFSGGFADAPATLQLNGDVDLDDTQMRVTTGLQNAAGSAFTKTPVNIQAFTTDFTFQIFNPVADGLTFTIQNQGSTALGGHGGGLGYRRISPSVAIKFDLYDNAGEGPNSTGIYTNGEMPAVPAVDLTGTGIDLHSQRAIKAHITYDGENLTMTLTDTLTLATWSHVWMIDIPATVGGPTAYVGFTGGTGYGTSADAILNWTYSAGPPAPNFPTGFTATNLKLNGSAILGSERLELTDGTPREAGTVFYSLPQNIQAFTTDFTFLLLNPAADGFTFTLQNDGPTALGSHGGGLGYRRIPKSVAVKFDLFNSLGEGSDSTGVYTGGELPALPAIDLTGSGIYLHSEDPFSAHLTYDGTNLTMTLHDSLTLGTWTHAWAIDIPAAVGGNTAYIGFTAGTGTLAANQMILTWTFVP